MHSATAASPRAAPARQGAPAPPAPPRCADEIDSVLSERSQTEHDAARRLKTEFLVQFDGVASDAGDRLVVLGATNRPWDLDEAVRWGGSREGCGASRACVAGHVQQGRAGAELRLACRVAAGHNMAHGFCCSPLPLLRQLAMRRRRRLVKRIYIALPDAASRRAIVSHLLEGQPGAATVSARDVEAVVRSTQGYSASDLAALCREAAMVPIRELGNAVQHVQADKVCVRV